MMTEMIVKIIQLYSIMKHQFLFACSLNNTEAYCKANRTKETMKNKTHKRITKQSNTYNSDDKILAEVCLQVW
jgi:hypothetical protein